MEDKDIIFLGGLTRSGSTLAANILQQHPSVFTVPTDPMAKMIIEMLHKVYEDRIGQAFSREVWDKGLYEFVCNGMQGYYNSLTDKPVVISKNRDWAQLTHVFKNSKHIVLIRDLFDVIDSQIRFQHSNHIVTPTLNGDLFLASLPNKAAIDNLMVHDLTFNWYIPRYVEMHNSNPDQILFVRYEDLTSNPNHVLDCINRFIGVDHFRYNINEIHQSSIYEHDSFYGGAVDNITHHTLTRVKRKPILHESWRESIIRNPTYTWYYKQFYPELLPTDVNHNSFTYTLTEK